ncbi:MAG: radical SAM protein [Candidatus Woesearchaeota archaeon]|nr:radical SAM protein [Candidatus Woesearchaeota archaeon]
MEYPTLQKSWKKGMHSLAIVYPNLYYGGVYSLAPLIFYNIVNHLPQWSCERKFLDKCEGLQHFDLVGFTFQYELDYFNLFNILKENKIPFEKEKREAIIFAGGPCITSNPETLTRYVDFFVLGDAEEVTVDILHHYETHPEKEAFLTSIAQLPGVYVPGKTKTIVPATADLNTSPYPIYQPLPETVDKSYVFGKSFLLEVERGCPFTCKFCTIPTIYPKLKYRKVELLIKAIQDGMKLDQREKVVMYAPSFVHPERKKLLQWLVDNNIPFSVPSLRLEYLDDDMLSLIRKGGQRSLTVAPEANERMRMLTDKKITDAAFLEMIDRAAKHGFEQIKMYFIIGLPEQTIKDLDEMLDFIATAKKRFGRRVHASINPLVPKPRTKYEHLPFDKEKCKEHMLYLNKHMTTKMKISDLKNAALEWKLAFAKDLDFIPLLQRHQRVTQPEEFSL